MTVLPLWQRYFLREILKVFFLFLSCFCLLYILIDYSMHMQEILKNKSLSLLELIYYYAMILSKRCDLLLPLSILIATVKVLTSLNHKNELLALQTGGISLHALTRPFFFVGLLCVGMNYLNFEILTPKSLHYIDSFEQTFLKKRKLSKKPTPSIQALLLEDGSHFLYQSYDPIQKEFFDVFWIHSIDKLYHMKTLSLSPAFPLGTYVDLMKRNEQGRIQKVFSYPTYSFETLSLDLNMQNTLDRPIENRSISELFQIAQENSLYRHDSQEAIQTHLYFKILIPWLPIFVLIGAIPFCVHSTRHLPTFIIFSLTIFGYIAFFTIMDACVILGETQVITPFWAIFSVPIAFLALFGIRFFRLCIRSK